MDAWFVDTEQLITLLSSCKYDVCLGGTAVLHMFYCAFDVCPPWWLCDYLHWCLWLLLLSGGPGLSPFGPPPPPGADPANMMANMSSMMANMQAALAFQADAAAAAQHQAASTGSVAPGRQQQVHQHQQAVGMAVDDAAAFPSPGCRPNGSADAGAQSAAEPNDFSRVFDDPFAQPAASPSGAAAAGSNEAPGMDDFLDFFLKVRHGWVCCLSVGMWLQCARGYGAECRAIPMQMHITMLGAGLRIELCRSLWNYDGPCFWYGNRSEYSVVCTAELSVLK